MPTTSKAYVPRKSFGRGLLASGSAIKACRRSVWPLPERRPVTPWAARLAAGGAVCMTSELPVNRPETRTELSRRAFARRIILATLSVLTRDGGRWRSLDTFVALYLRESAD
jgi:hypothetical protein